MLTALLLVASLGAPIQTPIQGPPDTAEVCLTTEQIKTVYLTHHLPVIELTGEQLAAFNAEYTKQFGHPAPEGINTILLIDRGERTQVFSFTDGCMSGNGAANTEVIHKLLSP